jgi:hypothetical protein
MNVRHTEALDSNAYPLGICRVLNRSRQLSGNLEDSGVERLFQIEDQIHMHLGNQAGVAWITGMNAEKGEEII